MHSLLTGTVRHPFPLPLMRPLRRLKYAAPGNAIWWGHLQPLSPGKKKQNWKICGEEEKSARPFSGRRGNPVLFENIKKGRLAEGSHFINTKCVQFCTMGHLWAEEIPHRYVLLSFGSTQKIGAQYTKWPSHVIHWNKSSPSATQVCRSATIKPVML